MNAHSVLPLGGPFPYIVSHIETHVIIPILWMKKLRLVQGEVTSSVQYCYYGVKSRFEPSSPYLQSPYPPTVTAPTRCCTRLYPHPPSSLKIYLCALSTWQGLARRGELAGLHGGEGL